MEGAQKESHLNQAFVAAALFFASASALSAQGRPELRADAIVSRIAALHAGGGILFPLGTYVRSGVIIGAGVADGSASFRADLLNLFHVDPFRESRWAPYGGGGLSFRHDLAPDKSRTVLVVLVGIEGPSRMGFAPAFELGLGGGVRAGLVMRRSGGNRR